MRESSTAVALFAWVACCATACLDADGGSAEGGGGEAESVAGSFAAGGAGGTVGATGGNSNLAGAAGTGGTSCTLVDGIPVDVLPAIDFDRYHAPAEMEAYLGSVAASLPAMAEFRVLGKSVLGQDLFYLVINATCQPNPPAVLAIGTHHGDEKASTEAVLALPDRLLRGSASDAAVRGLLERYAFYVLPLMNPDGYVFDSRFNADGMDLNRDYSYPERSDADSFSAIETRLVKSLQDSRAFRAAIAYHGGSEEVLWPWCHTDLASVDDAFFVGAGMLAARAMNMDTFQQSAEDFPTQGEYIDYAYSRHGTLAATFEVWSERTPFPSDLPNVVDTAYRGTVAWFGAVRARDSGVVRPASAASALRVARPFTAPFDGHDRLE
jgi:hypothetical protein